MRRPGAPAFDFEFSGAGHFAFKGPGREGQPLTLNFRAADPLIFKGPGLDSILLNIHSVLHKSNCLD
jgi:hypothetical protein